MTFYSSPDAMESKVYAESIIDAVSLSDDYQETLPQKIADGVKAVGRVDR